MPFIQNVRLTPGHIYFSAVGMFEGNLDFEKIAVVNGKASRGFPPELARAYKKKSTDECYVIHYPGKDYANPKVSGFLLDDIVKEVNLAIGKKLSPEKKVVRVYPICQCGFVFSLFSVAHFTFVVFDENGSLTHQDSIRWRSYPLDGIRSAITPFDTFEERHTHQQSFLNSWECGYHALNGIKDLIDGRDSNINKVIGSDLIVEYKKFYEAGLRAFGKNKTESSGVRDVLSLCSIAQAQEEEVPCQSEILDEHEVEATIFCENTGISRLLKEAEKKGEIIQGKDFLAGIAKKEYKKPGLSSSQHELSLPAGREITERRPNHHALYEKALAAARLVGPERDEQIEILKHDFVVVHLSYAYDYYSWNQKNARCLRHLSHGEKGRLDVQRYISELLNFSAQSINNELKSTIDAYVQEKTKAFLTGSQLYSASTRNKKHSRHAFFGKSPIEQRIQESFSMNRLMHHHYIPRIVFGLAILSGLITGALLIVTAGITLPWIGVFLLALKGSIGLFSAAAVTTAPVTTAALGVIVGKTCFSAKFNA